MEYGNVIHTEVTNTNDGGLVLHASAHVLSHALLRQLVCEVFSHFNAKRLRTCRSFSRIIKMLIKTLPSGTPYRTRNDVSGLSLVDPDTSRAPPLSLWPVSCRRHLKIQPIQHFINPLQPKLAHT
jgi:hypothetical protein